MSKGASIFKSIMRCMDEDDYAECSQGFWVFGLEAFEDQIPKSGTQLQGSAACSRR